MSELQIFIVGLGVYILIGYAFMHGLLWVSHKSLEHYPNVELESLISLTQSNVFIRVFMITLWPIIIVGATGTYLIDRILHRNHNH